ncbi:MAG: hypothetical protein H0X26_03550 [Alphaproteobacteria bacterium]|nr:hypothetical protein [Alphaproteobacteria bacterium]
MAKERPPKIDDHEKVDVIIESEQWESPSPARFTWQHGLILAIILGLAILFAFGFLIIAGIILLAAIVINIFLFILRKLA